MLNYKKATTDHADQHRDLVEFINRVKDYIKTIMDISVSAYGHEMKETLTNHYISGKCVRPQAMFLLARALGNENIDDLVKVGAALELVHRSTLLVDDIVDHSANRNLQPTVYSKLGIAKTTLISHLLTAKGLSLCPGPLTVDLLKSIKEVNIGQLAELAWDYDLSSYETIFQCYKKVACLKSGSFGRFALVAAFNGKADGCLNSIQTEIIAHHLAIAYQIANDLSDLALWLMEGSEKIPSDVVNGAPSYPLLLAWFATNQNKMGNDKERLKWYESENNLRSVLQNSDIIEKCIGKINWAIKFVIEDIERHWPCNAYSQTFADFCKSKWLNAYLGRGSCFIKQKRHSCKEEI